MSNIIPRNGGDNLRGMFERMVGNRPSGLSYDAARKHASVTGDVLRSSGESVVVGAVLGIVNASRVDGLDIRTSVTTKVGVPIDGLAAMLFGIAAIASAQEEHASDFVNAAAAAGAIFAFRKASDMVTEMNLRKSGITPGGGAQVPGKISKATFGAEADYSGGSYRGFAVGSKGEDPIVAAGRRL